MTAGDSHRPSSSRCKRKDTYARLVEAIGCHCRHDTPTRGEGRSSAGRLRRAHREDHQKERDDRERHQLHVHPSPIGLPLGCGFSMSEVTGRAQVAAREPVLHATSQRPGPPGQTARRTREANDLETHLTTRADRHDERLLAGFGVPLSGRSILDCFLTDDRGRRDCCSRNARWSGVSWWAVEDLNL